MKQDNFKKILIIRTDRIGDVLLSTPVIKALRKKFPQAHIAMMVRPYARDIILGNPYLDEIIIYDKYGKQRSFLNTLRFAIRLRRKRFDLALILHPTSRVHIVSYIAQIKKRIGFNRKLAFLLSDRIEHRKQEGSKHELEYTLDVIRYLGIKAQDKNLFMPIREDSEAYIEEFLGKAGLGEQDRLVVLAPGASCPSKIWPAERFAEVANKLTKEFKIKIAIIGAEENLAIAEKLKMSLGCAYIDAVGKTSVSQLASLLHRSVLFISNDSGPVHLAVAVGVPTIAVFGRAQDGLSPRRWGPQGKDDRILHKDVGCLECLAHNCKKGFLCLGAITVEDVLAESRKLLRTYLFDR